MVFLLILLDACDYGGCPFNDKVFETVALVKVSVHELFHGLAWQVTLLTFLVEFGLLRIYVINEIPKLTQGKGPCVGLGDCGSCGLFTPRSEESRPAWGSIGTPTITAR